MRLDEGQEPSITFRLEPSSGVPTYLQLVRQVEDALRLGSLAAGDQLPTVKEVVAALAINPNTVLKAYRELEHRGIASGRPGQGTYIQAGQPPVLLREQQVLSRRLDRWLVDAAASGLDARAVSALFQRCLQDFVGPTGNAEEAS